MRYNKVRFDEGVTHEIPVLVLTCPSYCHRVLDRCRCDCVGLCVLDRAHPRLVRTVRPGAAVSWKWVYIVLIGWLLLMVIGVFSMERTPEIEALRKFLAQP